jgi:hypothetical protein
MAESAKTCFAKILSAGLLCLCLIVAVAAGPESVVSGQVPERSPLWCTWTPENFDSGPGVGKTIVLISGDEEYRSEEAIPMLGKLLSKRFGFTCHALFAIDEETGLINPENQKNIPGMHLLEKADLVIMALRFRQLPDSQMRYFDDYLRSGKPIMAFRTSTHAFNYPGEAETSFRRYSFNSRDWPGGFGKQVLGETWVSHHGNHGSQSTRGVIAESAADHVVLAGVDDVWGPTDVYGINGPLPEGSTVLLLGQVREGMTPDSPPAEGKQNEPMMPLAWLAEYPQGNDVRTPVFCTTMGAATDFESGGLRRLAVNVALYLCGLEGSIRRDSDVSPVGEFRPTQFGFGGYIKGRRPADFQ